MTKAKILIIDDEENLRKLLARIIGLEGFTVLEAGNAKAGLKILESESVQVVITDVKLPDANGVELTSRLKSQFPAIEVILLTAYGTIEDGVRAMKNGAFDYLTKGDHQDKIIPLVNKACDKAWLQQKVSDLEGKLVHKFGFDSIIGSNQLLNQATGLAKKVAPTDTTVLILGETGVGKEVFAQAIHYESTRKSKPIVALNCSAFTRDLLESELFGHVEGAFTGASRTKKGLLEEAHEGTLFLDEIGEMNIDVQAKFLRVLEAGEFYRVGETKTRKVNIRVIAATNRNLEQEVEAGHFRRDLFYRLSVFTLTIPPLRERKEDIELLAQHFVKEFSLKTNKRVMRMHAGFLKALQGHLWKGNIRELKNVIERCVILADRDELTPQLLPSDFNVDTGSDAFDLDSVMKKHIQKVLIHSQGNKTAAAKLLGIGLTTLYQKIKDYGL
jgi:two-component system, NtrC family, response regulator